MFLKELGYANNSCYKFLKYVLKSLTLWLPILTEQLDEDILISIWAILSAAPLLISRIIARLKNAQM